MFEIFLVAQVGVVSAEVLIWVIGSILLLSFVALFFYQRLVGKELTLELTQLEKVQKHNIEYEFVLKAMKLCTWHIDAEARTITYDNDFRGKDDSVVLPPDTPIDALSNYVFPSDVAHLSKAIEELCQCHVEELHEVYRVHLPHTNKSYWSESYAAVASRNDEGKAKRIVGTSMRVDDRKAMEGALVEARNKAEESDRLKSAFIANMSHEIRTPLNALLQSLADMFLPKLASGVELSTQFARNSIDVTTDLNRMTEVINHLLSNAVKFTMQGTITVGYDEPAGKRLRIWIRDTGKGIAPEHLERIFERFFKVDEYIPGAGLGLSICRTMAYSMGGDVGVESTLGEGSLFWFEFPF